MTNEEAKRYWTARYEAARNWDDPHWEASERKDHRRYVDALKAAIEALSAERTGEWIENAPEGQYIDPPYICSICGHAESTRTPFCEQCGTKMKGGTENE